MMCNVCNYTAISRTPAFRQTLLLECTGSPSHLGSPISSASFSPACSPFFSHAYGRLVVHDTACFLPLHRPWCVACDLVRHATITIRYLGYPPSRSGAETAATVQARPRILERSESRKKPMRTYSRAVPPFPFKDVGSRTLWRASPPRGYGFGFGNER